MRVYLVRHGDAAPAFYDDQRTLSDKGVVDIKLLAKFISHLGIQVAQIFHSEKLRAIQTAEILSSVISTKAPMESLSDLDPISPVEHIVKAINAWNDDVVLVGHM